MKKQLIKNTMHLAQIMTWLEGGESQMKIGDSREKNLTIRGIK